jgi:hypothetical protein
MNFNNKSDVVRTAAMGRWLEILPAIVPALKDAANACPKPVLDPVNGRNNKKSGSGDGFRFFKDAKQTGGGISNCSGPKPNGFEVLMWVTGCDFSTALNDVANYLGINKWREQTVNTKAIVRSKDYCESAHNGMDSKTLEKRKYALRKTWSGSFHLTDAKSTLALKYLASRGLNISKLDLNGLSKTIRFHPSLELWHGEQNMGRYPALVSLVSYSDGTPACIHRTYLDQNGHKLKLAFDGESIPTKKLMARCKNQSLSGGAIRLGQAQESLHISEGIETALSVMQAKNEAVWPCISSTIMAKFEPPEGVKHIFVWADKDTKRELPNGKVVEAGLDAAMELFERMESKGITVTIMLPKDEIPENEKSVDWNDVLVRHGENAFPPHQLYMWQ